VHVWQVQEASLSEHVSKVRNTPGTKLSDGSIQVSVDQEWHVHGVGFASQDVKVQAKEKPGCSME
jgi:hypothetical protein